MSISEILGGPEKARGGLANTLETWIEIETGGMAVSGSVFVNETATATENIAGEKTIEEMNIVDELHLGITVHLPHLMDTLIKPRTTQTEKKASEYQCTTCTNHLSCHFLPRISPARSPRLTSPTPSIQAPSEATRIQKPVQPPVPPQPDPELDLEVDTAAVEEAARAARRARRQAILARYSGIASANKSMSPSPGPSSAVQPPPPVASVSDTLQPHSAVDTSVGSTTGTSQAQHDSTSKFLARQYLS